MLLEGEAKKLLESAGYVTAHYSNCSMISVLAFSLGAVAKQVAAAGGDCTYEYLLSLAKTMLSSPRATSFFYNFLFKDLGNLILCIDKTKPSDNMLAQSLKDLLKFTMLKKLDFALEDLWNYSQWAILGKTHKRFVVIDAGFSKKVQESGHYTRPRPIPLGNMIQTTLPEQNSRTFNGQSIDNIQDPHGKGIKSKFFTSKMSEYILSSDNMSRRIKKAGLQDDGLYQWSDKLVFMSYDHLKEVMDAIQKN